MRSDRAKMTPTRMSAMIMGDPFKDFSQAYHIVSHDSSACPKRRDQIIQNVMGSYWYDGFSNWGSGWSIHNKKWYI